MNVGKLIPEEKSLKNLLDRLTSYGIKLEQTTCYDCKGGMDCEFFLDPYNTCGDCLDLK